MVTDKFKPSHGPVKFNNTTTLTFSPFPKKVTPKVSNPFEKKTTTKEKTVGNVKPENRNKIKQFVKTGKVTQSFSDSNLLRLPHKSSSLSSSPPTGGRRQQEEEESGQDLSQKKLRKPSVSLSETQQQFNPNKKCDNSRPGGGGVSGKISTNSTRLIQQFPHKFCSNHNNAQVEVKGPKSRSNGHQKVKDQCAQDRLQQQQQQQQQQQPSIQVTSEGPQEDFTNKIMLASDGKKPLTLMEQKKLQWAREREELNGLWSPWGRPISNTSRPPNTTTSTYVNKLQTSSIQSEYHLPPIATNLTSPASRQAQLKSTLWTCDESMRVNGRSTLPICINATTGEVLYSKGGGVGQDDSRDTLHVNNAVVISSSNNNGSLHNALNIKALKYGSHHHHKDGKRHHHYSQQQSAHSASSNNNNNNCWSSVDEEAFTSGYHSEVNGSSNGEEYGSRKGSGSDGSKDGRSGPPNVIIHNIQVEPKLELPGGHFKVDTTTRSSRIPHNPPPAAMRSSITVGLDSSTAQPDAYKELQKLEKEKWLHELEKQREEQRLRRQQEKDEKRPKWGDKGIGVGHFWEPSNSTDHLPQPSRDDSSPASPPAWLEKGLSRLQNSVSQPSLYDAAKSGDREFQGPTTNSTGSSSLFTNQSTMDLRSMAGMEECERNYLRGNAASADSEMTVDAEKKRREAVEHQAAIRKQIEERQQRLKEERERRLQEELKDEETAKLHRLRELEHIELEARRMGMAMANDQSEESEEPPELAETKDIRKILDVNEKAVGDGRLSRETTRSAASSSARRLSLENGNEANESKVSTPIPQYLTSSQSMVNISTGCKKNAKSEPEDMGYPSNSSLHRSEKEDRDHKERQGSHRSRSLSSHREFGTQTDLEAAAAAAAQKKNAQKHHRSHNCLVKGSAEEDSPDGNNAKKKAEKPRWGATQSKKQYMKQSEKDPMYQQRLKRRVERIKKMEERLNGNGTLAPVKTADTGTGTESEDPQVPSTRSRARSPNRSRNRQSHAGTNAAAATEKSPKKQVPLKATARIQVSHKPAATPPKSQQEDSTRTRKIFPDIPGRTIGPLNSASHPDFENFKMGRLSSGNSSGFSSPSLESISSRNHIESHHYVRQRVTGDGDSVEVDLESRISTRSLEIHYEDQLKSSQQSKKRIIESSSDEITYRKTTVINQITSRISEEEAVGCRNSEELNPNSGRSHQSSGRTDENASGMDENSVGKSDQAASPLKTSTPKHNPMEPKARLKPEAKPRRPPPKNISSTDRDPEDSEVKPPEVLPKKKKGTRTPAARPISNPLINSSPLVSPVPIIIPYPTRMGSPPVPAVLKKLQAGIPIEDLPVCDDPLYEVPRAQTAGSTSNGYKSVESDSSVSNPPPLMLSRFSSDAGLEIDIDPTYVLSSIRIHAQSPEEHPQEVDHSFAHRHLHRHHEGTKINESEEDEEEYQEVLREAMQEDRRAPQIQPDQSEDKFEEDTDNKPSEDYDDEYYDDDDEGKTTDGYDEPIYPYPIPRISPRLKSQHSLLSPPMSPLIPRLSGRTTTLEVMADYRKFTLPDYDFDNVKLFPHVDVDGLDVTAAVQNIPRPGTQDTDLSKREKLISYVINNRDVQAQISARDSELSEKGIIEFNVRLPAHEDEDEEYGGGGGDFEDDYKDPLLSDRQRATIRWLYSSEDGSSSNSKDSVLTHLSYLKKGIQQQQHEWNVLPSDTEETDSYSQHNYSASTNENSSDESKYFKS